MQYEIVFKSDGLFMLYLPSSYYSCCCSKCSEDSCSGYWYWGSSDGSTSTHEHMAKNKAQHKHTCTGGWARTISGASGEEASARAEVALG